MSITGTYHHQSRSWGWGWGWGWGSHLRHGTKIIGNMQSVEEVMTVLAKFRDSFSVDVLRFLILPFEVHHNAEFIQEKSALI